MGSPAPAKHFRQRPPLPGGRNGLAQHHWVQRVGKRRCSPQRLVGFSCSLPQAALRRTTLTSASATSRSRNGSSSAKSIATAFTAVRPIISATNFAKLAKGVGANASAGSANATGAVTAIGIAIKRGVTREGCWAGPASCGTGSRVLPMCFRKLRGENSFKPAPLVLVVQHHHRHDPQRLPARPACRHFTL